MPKSQREQDRLIINAKSQSVLMRRPLTPEQTTIQINGQVVDFTKDDVYQPAGEIDYTKFTRNGKS